MRPYLLDFLVEAHSAFQLLPETLFLTVNLLDRYCSKRVVYKRHYQLVGCAALLIASKYGDKKEKVPTIKELKSMCCSLYDDDMFLQMEWHVLSTLDWTVGHPTVDSFVKLAVKDSIPDPETENLALYILEMALFHRDFVSKLSSTLALSALALARHILGRPQARAGEYASRYCETTLVGLSQKLHQPSEILSRKYASGRYSSVSRLLKTFLTEQAALAAAAAAAIQAPPSPPCEYVPASKPAHTEQYGYSTPQKPQPSSTVQYGYPTPPITPEEEYFGKPPPHHTTAQQYTPITPTPTASASHCSGFDYRSNYGTAPPSWAYETYQTNRGMTFA
jgi:Cyclin, N-terminal domain/Cyclin, C-terminal domain